MIVLLNIVAWHFRGREIVNFLIFALRKLQNSFLVSQKVHYNPLINIWSFMLIKNDLRSNSYR
jgi:hypothetical protein